MNPPQQPQKTGIPEILLEASIVLFVHVKALEVGEVPLLL